MRAAAVVCNPMLPARLPGLRAHCVENCAVRLCERVRAGMVKLQAKLARQKAALVTAFSCEVVERGGMTWVNLWL